MQLSNPFLHVRSLRGEDWNTLREVAGKVAVRLARDVFRQSSLNITFGRYKLTVPIVALGIGKSLAIRGYREPDQHFILRHILHEDASILDIGSNIGFYPVTYAEILNGKCEVFCYEPDQRSRAFLERNVALNGLEGSLRVIGKAVSDRGGEIELYANDWWNLSSVQASRSPGRVVVSVERVPVLSLSDALAAFDGPPDLLRMDIEGHEETILAALVEFGRAASGQLPRALVWESHTWEYQGARMQENIDALYDLGYRCRFVGMKGRGACPLAPLGYEPLTVLQDIDRRRAVYGPIRDDDALRLLATDPGISTICLVREH